MSRFLSVCAIAFAIVTLAQASDPQLRGFVRDENDAPVAAARITIRGARAAATGPWQTQSDPSGAFSIDLPAAGDYLVSVEREGYYKLQDRPIHLETTQEVTLVVDTVREVFQSMDVNEQPSPVDIAQTRNEERLTGTTVNDILYPNSHSLRNAMKLMPGVVEDPSGALHFNGSSENQVQYLLNGFNLTDPVSGNFHSILAVEGIRSVDYLSGRYSPELGKGTAGAVAIRTESGTDTFHYTATDFIPGLNLQQGLHLGNWYPRVGVSGPVVRGRAWFSDTFDSEYNNAIITGLPSGQNTRSGWAGSNLLHVQVNATSRNILYGDFLLNVDNENRVGLSPLDPVSTTQTVDTRQYFGSVKDQLSFGGKALIEFGYAHGYYSDSQTPQGQSLYVFSPQGRSGNYFVTGSQTSSRDQATVHGYAPQFHLLGTHQVEAGGDFEVLQYDGNFRRTGYELLGLSNQILSETTFMGPGIFGVSDRNSAFWVQDTWRITKRLQADAGLRGDWDQEVSATGWSPRIALSWAPFETGHTRVAGGYSITHDAIPLDPFGRALDQSASTVEYANGVAAGPPVLTTFALGTRALAIPRATNWSASVDHEITSHILATVKYTRRRGTEGFDFLNTLAPDAPPSILPLPNGASGGAYELANLRQDNFDSVEMSVRQSLSGQHEWMASYTHSSAQSNALIDLNSAEPLQVLPYLAPLPWDAPNRLLAWGYLPLPWKDWSLAVLADARTGFPFSVQEQTGIVSGAVDSHRFPMNFDLNLAIERMVTLRGYRFALRGGVDNLTDTRNPTAVNAVIGSPQYLQFLGNEGRHFVARIRFFGRAKK